MYDIGKRVQKIVEVDNPEVATLYLKNHWQLLSTHVTGGGNEFGRTERTVYCLGWPTKIDGSSPIEPTAEELDAVTGWGKFLAKEITPEDFFRRTGGADNRPASDN